MDSVFSVSILGTIASLAGLAVAGIQIIRLRQVKRRTNADVWLSIRTVISMVGKLETSESRKQDTKVSEVYSKSVELYRHLLKQAIMDEKNFSEETILKWRAAGKLHSDWQEAQARHFLATAEIKSSKQQTSKKQIPESKITSEEKKIN